MGRQVWLVGFIFMVTGGVSLHAQAQSFEVKKVKGRQALIQMSDGQFYQGQTVKVGQGRTPSGMGGSTGPRDHFVGFSAGFYQSTSNGSNSSTLETAVLYGWNKLSYEYGVLGGLSLQSGSTSVTTISVGGKFDYNFAENRPGIESLFAVGIQGSYASVSGGGTQSRMTLFPSGSWRWFVLGTPTAVRFDLGYEMNQASTSSGSSNSNGLKVTGGFQVYF